MTMVPSEYENYIPHYPIF